VQTLNGVYVCRFEHSLGVAYMAYSYAIRFNSVHSELQMTNNEVEAVTIAGKHQSARVNDCGYVPGKSPNDNTKSTTKPQQAQIYQQP
jgi:hypothetical protein